jgi:hypothetical protein
MILVVDNSSINKTKTIILVLAQTGMAVSILNSKCLDQDVPLDTM